MSRRSAVTTLGALASLLLAAPAGMSAAARDPGLSVAGEYATAVALTENGCEGIEVRPNPTRIAQAPGDSAFVLTHAGLSYDGIVARDGRFATRAKAIDAGIATHTLAIAGRFTERGFDATVTADVTFRDGRPACRYVVTWTGAKAGEPNTIPGR
jgi:hypothetical protein